MKKQGGSDENRSSTFSYCLQPVKSAFPIEIDPPQPMNGGNTMSELDLNNVCPNVFSYVEQI